ncbi:hypothetical protein [Desulfolucanica intricata]|uniref:hypothetical protein n=1 Tax=Desulfolucanica intricata TaxID=1285191 RepID=UPI0008360A09|nr:hypothetical protein [Desulfolucanica intricata]
MSNPLLIFLVLILLLGGAGSRFFKVSSSESGNTDSNDKNYEQNKVEEINKIKEEIFYPKVITNLTLIEQDEDSKLG